MIDGGDPSEAVSSEVPKSKEGIPICIIAICSSLVRRAVPFERHNHTSRIVRNTKSRRGNGTRHNLFTAQRQLVVRHLPTSLGSAWLRVAGEIPASLQAFRWPGVECSRSPFRIILAFEFDVCPICYVCVVSGSVTCSIPLLTVDFLFLAPTHGMVTRLGSATTRE